MYLPLFFGMLISIGLFTMILRDKRDWISLIGALLIVVGKWGLFYLAAS